MQRHPALRDLSSDHHSGLVLARKAQQATLADKDIQAETWMVVRTRFYSDLEPHFVAEETGLLPALSKAGGTALVERTLHEHEALQKLVAEDQMKNLGLFAELLRAHICFEEQELFEKAQQILAGDGLDKLTSQIL